MTGVTLSAIMVSYRTGPTLFGAVRSALKDDAISELIIVDNGNAEDDRLALLALRAELADERLYLVQGQGNIGFSRACNYGASLASGSHLLFVNPDAEIDEGAAACLLAAGRAHPSPCIVGGHIRHPDGREQRGGRRGPLTLMSAAQSVLPFWPRKIGQGYDRSSDPLPNSVGPMPVISGALFVIDKAGFKQLGGFDEGYFLHVEDVDLCARVRAAGGTVLYHPQAGAVHHRSTSDVPSHHVQRYKAQSLLRYFWRSSGFFGKFITILMTPAVWAALWLKRLTGPSAPKP